MVATDSDDPDSAVHDDAEALELALGATGQGRLLVAQLRQDRRAGVHEVDAAAADRGGPRGEGGGELDAGEATADDDEVGGLTPGRRVLEDDEAAEEPAHVAGAAQGEAVLAHAGHVLHRLAAARGDDELVVAGATRPARCRRRRPGRR